MFAQTGESCMWEQVNLKGCEMICANYGKLFLRRD